MFERCIDVDQAITILEDLDGFDEQDSKLDMSRSSCSDALNVCYAFNLQLGAQGLLLAGLSFCDRR